MAALSFYLGLRAFVPLGNLELCQSFDTALTHFPHPLLQKKDKALDESSIKRNS
jgi:hypothetical protein